MGSRLVPGDVPSPQNPCGWSAARWQGLVGDSPRGVAVRPCEALLAVVSSPSSQQGRELAVECSTAWQLPRTGPALSASEGPWGPEAGTLGGCSW